MKDNGVKKYASEHEWKISIEETDSGTWSGSLENKGIVYSFQSELEMLSLISKFLEEADNIGEQ
ncbi:MAG: hypothetical protein PHC41_01285 [Lachnospiraceae bacterium]|nr:hypothetical protein [Lachnospiraceae bacterium]MDD3614840.1 hypothetical protein [Lachnospiraceae bacterium]